MAMNIIISPNEVFGDIMALASPPPRPPPPVDPDNLKHSNSKKYSTYLFQILYVGRYPLRYFAIEIWYPPRTRTAFAAKRHSYPPNLQNAISP